MKAEAEPLLKALALQRDEPPVLAPPAPAVSFSGEAFGLDLHIVCNGGRSLAKAWFCEQLRSVNSCTCSRS